MADNSYFQSPSVNYDSFYSGSMTPPVASGGKLTQAQLSKPATASTRPTAAQLAAMQAVPAGSYQTPPNRPVMAPNIPAGSQYANTGNAGRATPEMQQLIQLASTGGARPPWTVPGAAGAPNVPLPRRRPGSAPTWMDFAAMSQQKGANPGMGGAMFGNGVMAPGIAPQGPPPAGIAPTVWAGAATPPPPTTFRGSSTGNAYNIGQTYTSGGYLKMAMPDGTFKTIGKDPNYQPRVNNYGAGGFTSSGQSRTLPSGESWAAGGSSSGDTREPSGTGSLW